VVFPFARKRYYETYRTVELQNTFYDLPGVDYAEKLRAEAPEDFIFNMKAWQVITHSSRSPTWRRMRHKPPGKLENYGELKPTSENIAAWIKVLEFARAINARTIVLQTPPSFGYSEENAERASTFFKIALEKMHEIGLGSAVAWEPRGTWHEHLEVLRNIVCRHGIIHVVDPLRRSPIICEGQRLLYFRLHGLGGREVNYRYRYTDEDLARLASIVKELLETHSSIREAYVMFNNVYMAQDSVRFREEAKRRGLAVC